MEGLNYKVSTITMSMQIPECKLNLNNIGRYLEIDEIILGIKYHSGNTSIIKGKYLTSIYQKSKGKNENKINKRLFYNQVSLIIKHKYDQDKLENTVNVKIFGNGSLHLTGVKDKLEGEKILLIIYNKLMELKKYSCTILLTKDTNNIYLDSNSYIYSITNKHNIGYKKDILTYVISKKEYHIAEIENEKMEKIKVFLSKKLEAKRTRIILDMNGVNIGFTKINLIKNKSKLYKNNSNIHIDNNLIFYDGVNNSVIIGNITNHLSYKENDKSYKKNSEIYESENIIEYIYNCNPFITEPNNERLNNIENLNMNINTINIYFKLSFQLNRQRLFSRLLELGYQSEYTPEKYSGVKLSYKLNKNYLNDGKCLCSKCTCNNITFLIFQSGNIITTGFKDKLDILNVLNAFNVILNKISSYITKKEIKMD